MSKIHILGANSYIGSLLVNYLEAAGHEVERSTYRLPNVPEKSIVADFVVHLAVAGGGTTHVPRSGEGNPGYMRKVNIRGMKAFLKGIANARTKIIFISSTAVYGKFTDSPLVNEDSELTPVSEYGKQKAELEKILQKSDFDWMIFRPSGVFGPSANNKFGNSFLNVVLKDALQKGEITILDSGQKIDSLYLPDLVTVILRSCSGEWHSHGIFNVAGEIVSVKIMLQILSKAINNLGIPCNVTFKKFNGKPAVLADIQKLQMAFPGWKNTPLSRAMYSLASAYVGYLNR